MKGSRFYKSLNFAIRGIIEGIRNERSMRYHILIAFFVIILGIFFSLTATEWCIILLCIGSVISAELMNTSIEVNTDLTSPEYNEKAGLSKDIAAGAVLLTCLISVLIGLIIFTPKLIHLINS
jgi:diacylglycerol kinase